MSIKIQPRRGSTRIQFILPDDVHDGPVSVVGTFNDWTPGVHKLVRRSNGTRSVSVEVPAGEDDPLPLPGVRRRLVRRRGRPLLEGQGALVSA